MSTQRFAVYTIVKRSNEAGKDFWQRVGTAFQNKDSSLTVRLNALPVNGTLHIREEREDDATSSSPRGEQPASNTKQKE